MVEQLRTHAVAGRLDAAELAARAEDAYRARTVGELALVLGDLPARAPVAPRRARPLSRPSRRHVAAYGVAAAVDFAVLTATIDGVQGPLDEMAVLGFWATLAWGGVLAAWMLAARVRITRRRPERPAL